VTDGPFTETKELLAGFWMIQVKSTEEAIAWALRAPFGEGEERELREVLEAPDFPSEIVSREDVARARHRGATSSRGRRIRSCSSARPRAATTAPTPGARGS
jgi:YCII-related domain